MPSTVNGIGTWYYGQQNIHRIKSSCEFCNRVCELKSYDTTLYFVIFYIPVIPLSKKRILDECVACQRHRYMSLKEWEKSKTTAMTATLANLAEKPNDSDALGAALATATQFQDAALFDRIASYVKVETENPKLQLLLGETSGYFGRREDADAAFANAIRVNPSPEVYKPAAMNALRMGDPERAAELLEYVTAEKVKDDLGYLQIVIDSMQGVGLHTEALALMDKRDQAFPDLASDKEFVKARKQSEKYAGTSKKLNTVNLIEKTDRFGSSSGGGAGNLIAKLIFPLILIAALVAYLYFSWHRGQHATIYVVNGTSTAYTAKVNGNEHRLNPLQATKVELAEGDVSVEMPGREPVKQSLTTNYWTRIFSRPVWIFNPDLTAVIVEEQSTYSKTPITNPPPKYMIGQSFYSLKRPDYLFEPFPGTIKSKGTVTKHRIGIETGLPPAAYLSLAVNPKFGNEKNKELLKALAEANPDELSYLQFMLAKDPGVESMAFLKKGCAARPLRVEWHRVYQSMIERTEPKTDLMPEYKALHEELKSADSLFLLARTIPETQESFEKMKEAATMAPPSTAALFSLSYRMMCVGNFPEALSWLKKAEESSPTPLFNRMIYRDRMLQVYWANRDYARYREISDQSQGLSTKSMESFKAACAEKNQELMQMYRQQIQSEFMTDLVRRMTLLQECDQIAAMVNGDVAKYLKMTQTMSGNEDSGNPIIPFVRLLLQKKNDDCAQKLDDEPGMARAIEVKGLLALAFAKSGQQEKADEWLSKMAYQLENEGRAERSLARTLLGKKPLIVDDVLNSIVTTEVKRVILLVFAQKYPDHAEKFVTLAKKLNYHTDEVSLVITQMEKK